jgi:hypothetical protein
MLGTIGAISFVELVGKDAPVFGIENAFLVEGIFIEYEGDLPVISAS